MFGEDSRFVEFTNLTGRLLRLSGRLEVERMTNMAWTTSVIIDPGVTHVWRFLGGDDRQEDFSLLTLLPDPYLLALENSFTWTAEFIDSSEDDTIIFDNKSSPLHLRSLPILQSNDRAKISLRRKSSPVPTLRRLAADSFVLNKISKLASIEPNLENLNIPRILQTELFSLLEQYLEIKKKRVKNCDRCQEIHHQL